MAAHSDMASTADHERSQLAKGVQAKQSDAELSRFGPQDPLAQHLQRVADSARGGAGATLLARKEAALSLQRQHATILGDARLQGPRFAQRRAEVFLQLQRSYGNAHARQVAHLLQEQRRQAEPEVGIQRLIDPASHLDDRSVNLTSDPSTANQSAKSHPSSGSQAPVERSVTISVLPPIPVSREALQRPNQGPGDFPTPDPTVAMAKRSPDAVVQRDDTPHMGVDAQGQGTAPIVTPRGESPPTPWTLQMAAIYRNQNLLQIKHFDFGHEPLNLTLGIDPNSGVALQYALGLINSHWMPPWNRELEVGLSSIANVTLLPRLTASLGGQVQAEQHIVPWFSVTASLSGMYTPPQGGKPGQFAMTGSAGVTFHFEGPF